jgi:hypothetical protein
MEDQRPMMVTSTEYYFIVTSAKGGGTVDLNDWESFGDNYFMDARVDTVASDSNITIYSSNITSPSTKTYYIREPRYMKTQPHDQLRMI